MCGHVVLLWMDFPNQMFASAHLFQIYKYIGRHKNVSCSWALRTNLFCNALGYCAHKIYTSCAALLVID